MESGNFAHVITSVRLPAMHILVWINTVKASPQIGEILPHGHVFWLSCPYLFSQSYAQVEPLDRFSHFMAQTMCFRPRMVLLGL